jgi:capsular exopolysaccharide synthesis family protein
MENNSKNQSKVQQEIALKSFVRNIFNNKWFFILSICTCLALAFLYIKLATPKYEASTSLLIDAEGSNRVLGENSRYVEGGVGLIEMEKNLYNEIGIIKSYSLIRQTVEDLDFDLAYYVKDLLKTKEAYGYFPFEVKLDKSKSQIYGSSFKVDILSKDKYRLTLETDKFVVSNPSNNTTRTIERGLAFSEEFYFGDTVEHDYFNFEINRPDYDFSDADFNEMELSFIVNNLDNVANAYSGNLAVENIDIQASIFKLSSTGPVVDKEVDFLRKLTENYVRNKLKSRNKIASTKEAFIQDQLKTVSDSLVKVEKKLEAYKKEKRALNLGVTATNALEQTSNLQVNRSKLNLNINYYKTLIENVESNRNSENFEIPTAVGITDPLINENIIELKRLYSVRAKKKFYVTSNNEEMSIINNQIEASTDLLLNNLRNSIKSSEYKLSTVTSQISNYDGVINSLPTRENELLNIQRQSTLYENLYKYLSEELAKTGIARAEDTSDTRILDTARMAGSGPISPQKNLLLLLGFIIGVLIPFLWIVFFSAKDIIENVNQIMANTDIPVIASIVHDETTKKSKSNVALWQLKESFRDLSTNLRFVSKEPCVIGMTSIMPEEGKTYNAINLGITFAEAGKKTLIIDTDLRNPSLVKGIGKIEGKTLVNYLQGDVALMKDIIYPHEEVKNLDFIPTTVIEGNVHEVLSGDGIKSLVMELKNKYDYIILDTPAVGLVSDFILLSDIIDINLFVVRRNLAKIEFLADLEKLDSRSRHAKKKKSFIIFNDVPKKDHKYGYEDKYGRNNETQLVNKSLSV